MSERPVLLLLQDIMDACEHITDYTLGLSYIDFANSELIQHAVERNIEIIGEACNKMPQEFMNHHSHVEWRKAIGMRNRLIHGYFAVDLPLLWNTTSVIIPVFKNQVKSLLQNMQQ